MSFEPEIGDLIHLEDNDFYSVDQIVLVLKKTEIDETRLRLKVIILQSSYGTRHDLGLCDYWGFVRGDKSFKLLERLSE